MALLPKKYLRIHDVAEYLNSLDAGYEYDLSESSDRYKLNDDIYDLVVHGELKAVFKHCTDDFIQAYLIVHDTELEAILRFNSSQNMSDAYLVYSYMNSEKIEKDKVVKIVNHGSIGFDDIYIPKEGLDSLFNPSNSPAKQIEKLQAENDKLNARLSKASDIYWQNQSEIKELKAQLEKANAESADLKEQLINKIDAPADDSILQTILDVSTEHYAPDLKHAIQLWIDLYINKNMGGGSHSAMANNWIYKHTGYNSSEISSPVKRLREITTPFKDFGGQRPKEVEK